jgi:alkanesulfonate monooxygenase SsuD/methylene tetrahydromethanopterin reductase-like flavin-dependent oxidoreductase (luciferase family)
MQLFAIDILWSGHVKTLVPCLERLGYHRFWATEHHSLVQSASPIVMTAIAAALSSRMRVGTAGVMLRLYSPVKVVEDFLLLELLFPGCLDLEIVGATPKEPLLSRLLDGRSQPDDVAFAREVTDLVRLLNPERSKDRSLDGAQVGPQVSTTPQIWLCGTSRRSALLAGELGAGVCVSSPCGASRRSFCRRAVNRRSISVGVPTRQEPGHTKGQHSVLRNMCLGRAPSPPRVVFGHRSPSSLYWQLSAMQAPTLRDWPVVQC